MWCLRLESCCRHCWCCCCGSMPPVWWGCCRGDCRHLQPRPSKLPQAWNAKPSRWLQASLLQSLGRLSGNANSAVVATVGWYTSNAAAATRQVQVLTRAQSGTVLLDLCSKRGWRRHARAIKQGRSTASIHYLRPMHSSTCGSGSSSWRSRVRCEVGRRSHRCGASRVHPRGGMSWSWWRCVAWPGCRGAATCNARGVHDHSSQPCDLSLQLGNVPLPPRVHIRLQVAQGFLHLPSVLLVLLSEGSRLLTSLLKLTPEHLVLRL
mmetsp:Transcript_68903/g.165382  ORF Transcript_68903/g.165382 Transcript_68903/m.165382 type:complete len:264 (+) Transcript_68903:444-1235(+)